MTTSKKRKSYPRSAVRKILAGHAQKKIGKQVDSLIYLDYVLFMSSLIKNAERKAKESGETRIAARDLRKVTISTLRKFKG